MLSVTPNMEEFQNSQRFDKAFKLNLDIGGKFLRLFVDLKLLVISQPLKSFLQLPDNQSKFKDHLKKKILHKGQLNLLRANDVSLEKMDISLLTYLLLNLFQISSQNQKDINELRNCRNELAHATDARLKTDDVFNRTFDRLKSICRELDCTLTTTNPGADVETYTDQLVCDVQELEKQNLVIRVSHRYRIELCQEKLMTALMEISDSLTEDPSLEIKYQIIMGTRYIGRHLDVDVLIDKLRAENIVNHRKKMEIQQEHDSEEKASLLVFELINNTHENVLKFLKCLQELNPEVAEWITGDLNDTNIGRKQKELEKNSIRTIIEVAVDADRSNSISGEDLHVYVEENRKCFVTFSQIKDCMQEMFPDVNFIEKSNRFSGVTWKSHVTIFDDTQLPDSDEPLSNMPSEEFAIYLKTEIKKTTSDPVISDVISGVITKESISLPVFVDMNADELKDCFETEFEKNNKSYGIGIRKSLLSIQTNLKRKLNSSESGTQFELRPFGEMAGNHVYKSAVVVKSTVQNPLTPVHCFVLPRKTKELHPSFFASEVIKFSVACINGRQNGTFHFGVKPHENDEGSIVGINSSVNSSTTSRLQLAIHYALRHCFPKEMMSILQRTMKPVVRIPVDDKLSVYEVDIEPSTTCITKNMLNVLFPPYGEQNDKCFLMILRQDIAVLETIDQRKVKHLSDESAETFKYRKKLELSLSKKSKISETKLSDLQKRLTAGNRFATEQLVPHIVSGNYSNCLNMEEILSSLAEMSTVFTSSSAVFDFDSSTKLIAMIEDSNRYFDISVADDPIDQIISGPTWLYCNGNDDRKEKQTTVGEWMLKRQASVYNLINICFEMYHNRALFIILVFEMLQKTNPLHTFATYCCQKYRQNTLVICERDEFVKSFKLDLDLPSAVLENMFFTVSSWLRAASVMVPVFPSSPDNIYKLPTGIGSFVIMTRKERHDLDLNDIELVSGEECIYEVDKMEDEERVSTAKEHEDAFYKGNEVSWWNFYFDVQVCKRDLFENIISDIDDMIETGINRFEVMDILHQPGAGGSTLGRHVIWHLSQFKRDIAKKYRCCIVKKVSEKNTAKQITEFRKFREEDPDIIKPVIVLADNLPDESLRVLKDDLDIFSYRYGSKSGKLFCLLLVVTRINISKDITCSSEHILRQTLSKREKTWFEQRSTSLEESKDYDLTSLVAFNVMKQNFNAEYIKNTTERIMEGLKPNEETLIQHLSLINTFDGNACIATDIFDELMGCNISTYENYNLQELIESKMPAGLAGSKRRRVVQFRQTWNVQSTESLELLIKHQSNVKKHILVVSPLIANALLQRLIGKHNFTLETLVQQLLSFMESRTKHSPNSISTRCFVEVICNLFKVRQRLEKQEGVERNKFSNLVLNLSKVEANETKEDAFKRTDKLMKHCFEISKDAFVGQQRARICIHFQEFEAAIQAMELSIKECKKVPILFDTYGQIYKAQLEHKIKDQFTDPKSLIRLATSAIEMFTKAQALDKGDDFGSYLMEVLTALRMLENVVRENKLSFWKYLNHLHQGKEYDNLQPEIQVYCKDSELQVHLAESLRHIEYVSSMTKRPFHERTTKTESERAICDLRTRFERIYGADVSDNDQILIDIGETFKSVKEAYRTKINHLKKKVAQIHSKLHTCVDLDDMQKDVLVFMGYQTLKLSLARKKEQIDLDLLFKEYNQMLSLSEDFLKSQRNARMRTNIRWRPYIETYMYFVLFHWPLQSRLQSCEDKICKPEFLSGVLKEWEEIYDQRFDKSRLSDASLMRRSRPTTFFSLADGRPGFDIVDQDLMRKKWRKFAKKEGRFRQEVKEDDIWNHEIGQETYIRLSGLVDYSGNYIYHKVSYHDMGNPYQFQIATNGNYKEFRNRQVTFVLCFSWRGPLAFAVQEVDNSDALSKDDESESLVPEEIKVPNVGASLTEMEAAQRHLMLLPDVKRTLREEGSRTLSPNPKGLTEVRESVSPTSASTLKSSPRAVSGESAVKGRGRGRSRGLPLAYKSDKVATRPGRSSAAQAPNVRRVGAITERDVTQSVSSAAPGQFRMQNVGKTEAKVVGTSSVPKPVERDLVKMASDEFSMQTESDGAKGDIIPNEDESNGWEEATTKRGRRQRKTDKKKENRK